MKKMILWMIAAIPTICGTMSAQAQEYGTKHEIAVSYGAGSNSDIISFYENTTLITAGMKVDNDDFTGPVSLEYFYHTNKWLGIGGIFVYAKSSQDLFLGSTKSGSYSNTYYTLMPAAKFDWLRKKHFGMYSKLGLGITMCHVGTKYDDSTRQNDSDNDTYINWQASLLGMEAGGSHLRGFVELGFGEQGIFLAGIRCKF